MTWRIKIFHAVGLVNDHVIRWTFSVTVIVSREKQNLYFYKIYLKIIIYHYADRSRGFTHLHPTMTSCKLLTGGKRLSRPHWSCAEIGQTPGLKKFLSESAIISLHAPQNDVTHLSLEVGHTPWERQCLSQNLSSIQKGAKCTCDKPSWFKRRLSRHNWKIPDCHAISWPINHRTRAPYPRNRCNSSERTINRHATLCDSQAPINHRGGENPTLGSGSMQ
jgi:hypothetical protein